MGLGTHGRHQAEEAQAMPTPVLHPRPTLGWPHANEDRQASLMPPSPPELGGGRRALERPWRVEPSAWAWCAGCIPWTPTRPPAGSSRFGFPGLVLLPQLGLLLSFLSLLQLSMAERHGLRSLGRRLRRRLCLPPHPRTHTCPPCSPVSLRTLWCGVLVPLAVRGLSPWLFLCPVGTCTRSPGGSSQV